jgi:Flp pilus assembly protein TadG
LARRRWRWCFTLAAPAGLGATHAVLGLIVGLAVFFPLFALGAMGAGDVKLMAALGAWVGWQPVILVALYGSVAGACWRSSSRHEAVTSNRRFQTSRCSECTGGERRQTTSGAHAGIQAERAASVRGRDRGRIGGDIVARLISHLRRKEDGAELIEMAIVLPLLLLLIMGIVDFGFMFQRYVVLTNAAARARAWRAFRVRRGGRRTRVDRYATNGGITGVVSAVPIAVNLPGAGGGSWPGRQVTVTYVYTFNYIGPIAAFFGSGPGGTVTLRSRATMRRQVP